ALTDVNGNYSLSLNPGKYVVCEVAQPTWFQSEPNNTKCAAIAGLGAGGYAITVTSNSSETGNNFGNFQQGTKSGAKYNDLNANGTRDAGEPGLPNWTIRAYVDASGDGSLQNTETTVAASATTDVNGNYSLSLNPGKYVVCEVAQATWSQSQPNNTKCAAIAGLSAGGYAITVTSNSSETGNNFGNYQNATKTGVKFEDVGVNHVKDANDPGLNGWVINAYTDANKNGVLDPTEFSAGATATDTTHTVGAIDGVYSLSLKPGSYL